MPGIKLLEIEKCPSRIFARHRDAAIYERAGSRIRTDDLLITNQLLYQLSYAGVYLGKPPRGAIPKIEQAYTTISAALLKQISPTNTVN
jgi:hypothetical protein